MQLTKSVKPESLTLIAIISVLCSPNLRGRKPVVGSRARRHHQYHPAGSSKTAVPPHTIRTELVMGLTDSGVILAARWLRRSRHDGNQPVFCHDRAELLKVGRAADVDDGRCLLKEIRSEEHTS